MNPVYCYRCSQSSFSTDGVPCFYCDKNDVPRAPITNNSIPVVPEPGNESKVYYVSDASTQTTDDDFLLLEPIQDASTQTTDDDFLLLEPIQDASSQTTESDFSYLDQIVGYHEYAEGHEIIFPSQVRAPQVFDQNFAENHNLSPENMNINNEDFHIMNINRDNNATIGPSPESMNDSYVLPKKRAYIDEEPPTNEIQNISNRYKLLKMQGTEYSGQSNEAGKLNFAGSIGFLSEYECPNTNPGSSGNVNKPGGSPEYSNSSTVLSGTINDPSIKDRFPKNVDPTKAILEQDVQNSGKWPRNVFEQRVPAKRAPICRKCGKGYLNESILKIHVENNCDPNLYKCDQCEKKFPSKSALRNHQRVHTTVFEQRLPAKRAQICGKCGKGYLNESILKIHMENNCDPNPYKCDQCEKKFPSKSALRNHERVHTTDQSVHTTVFEQRVPAKRAQICGKCGKGFLNESIFKIHVENNCDPKPYKCDQCEKKFFSNSALRIHQSMHTNDKPFKCDQCPFTSRWNQYLKDHKNRCH